ncbi:hypothetical protein D0463_02795 [Bacillus sp. V59.32b]|nr:hypothetical protein D0463_02795 [Bacillus sp. V59.32b]
MKRAWEALQLLLVKSRLRVTLYALTLITGIGFFFVSPDIFLPTVFITLLGSLLVFESIHLDSYHSVFLGDMIPGKLRTTISVFVIIIGISLGVFLIFIGIGVEVGRHFR